MQHEDKQKIPETVVVGQGRYNSKPLKVKYALQNRTLNPKLLSTPRALRHFYSKSTPPFPLHPPPAKKLLAYFLCTCVEVPHLRRQHLKALEAALQFGQLPARPSPEGLGCGAFSLGFRVQSFDLGILSQDWRVKWTRTWNMGWRLEANKRGDVAITSP